MTRRIHFIGVFLCLFAAQVRAESWAHDIPTAPSSPSTTRSARPVASENSQRNCWNHLDAQQSAITDQVREIVRTAKSNEEAANQLYQLAQSQPDPDSKSAVAIAIAGALELVGTGQAQDPNGPLQADVEKLIRFGAKATPAGLDLTKVRWSEVKAFKDSLGRLYPEAKGSLDNIDNVDSYDAVILGKYVVLPKYSTLNTTTHRFDDSGPRTLTVAQYRHKVEAAMENISKGITEWMESDNEAASTWVAVKSGFRNPEERGVADAAFGKLSRSILYLKNNLGVAPEITQALRTEINAGVQQNTERIWEAYEKAKLAAIGTALSPLVWPILAAGGATAAVFGGGMALTAAVVTGTALTSTANGNGTFACNMGKALLEKGPSGFLASLAAAGVTTAFTAAASGLATASATGMISTATAETIVGTAQGLVSGAVIGNSIATVVSEGRKVDELEAAALRASAAGNEATAQQFRALADEVRIYQLEAAANAALVVAGTVRGGSPTRGRRSATTGSNGSKPAAPIEDLALRTNGRMHEYVENLRTGETFNYTTGDYTPGSRVFTGPALNAPELLRIPVGYPVKVVSARTGEVTTGTFVAVRDGNIYMNNPGSKPGEGIWAYAISRLASFQGQ